MMTFSNDDNFRQRLDYIKNNIDVGYLMSSLGFSISNDTASEVRAACKIHGGDNTTAFRLNKENNTWQCFTHRCHEAHGYDVISLVKACNNISFIEAVEYLENMVGGSGDFVANGVRYRSQKNDDKFVDEFSTSLSPKIVNEDSLIQFKYFRSDRFIKDGFKKSTLDHFEVAGGYTDSYGIARDIIPIRDLYGDLVAYSLRDIRYDYNDDFKYILTKDFDKDSVLYNLNNVKTLCETQPLIVVEGFKSVWRLYECGIKNVVCIMGSSVTPGQLSLLSVYAINGVIILLDNDKAGVEGCIKAVSDLEKDMPDVSIIPIFITETDDEGKGLDPSDLTDDLIFGYLENFLGNKK